MYQIDLRQAMGGFQNSMGVGVGVGDGMFRTLYIILLIIIIGLMCADSIW
jgi:hypothetical protein